MAGRMFISPLNALKFTPLDAILPKRYNTDQFDMVSYYDYIKAWQVKEPYYYKIQRHILEGTVPGNIINIDTFPIVVVTDQPQPVEIVLLDCMGNDMGNDNLFAIPNTPTVMNGNIQVTYQQYDQVIIEQSLPNGVYYVLLKYEFDNTNNGNPPNDIMQFLSEPILVEDRHPNTVLLEYRNSYNKDFMPFQQMNGRLSLRVEGLVFDMQPKLQSTSFQDQNFNTSLLSAQAYRGWTFFIGGNGEAVPEYVIDKINHILSCDELFIDGKRYSLADGASIEKIESNDSLFYAKVELVEYNNHAAFDFRDTDQTLIIVRSLPIAYPFAIYGMQVGSQAGWIFNYATLCRHIYDSTQLDSYISLLNGLTPAAGMTGVFALYQYANVAGKSIVYTLGAGEVTDDFNISKTTVMDSRFTMTYGMGAAVTEQMQIEAYPGSKVVISFGVENTFVPIQYSYNNNVFLAPFTIPAGSGNVEIDVFYTQNIKGIIMDDMGYLKALYGLLPNALWYFAILNTTAFTQFSMLPLIPSRNTLQSVWIAGTNAASISDFYNSNTGFIKWLNLKMLNFRANKITVNSIEDYLNEMLASHYAGKFVVSNGTFRCEVQTPNAPLTNTSAIARANLISTYNWTIVNN